MRQQKSLDTEHPLNWKLFSEVLRLHAGRRKSIKDESSYKALILEKALRVELLSLRDQLVTLCFLIICSGSRSSSPVIDEAILFPVPPESWAGSSLIVDLATEVVQTCASCAWGGVWRVIKRIQLVDRMLLGCGLGSAIGLGWVCWACKQGSYGRVPGVARVKDR